MSAAERPLSATLVRNAVYGGGGRLITLAVGLVMTPYLYNQLGAERFGIWALVALVTGAVGLLDFSFKTAFIKHLSEAGTLRDRTATAAILSTGLFVYLLFSGLVLVAFFLGDELVLSVLNIPPDLLQEARHVFWVGLAGFLFSSVMAVFPAVCDARQRMDITNALGVGALVIGTALTVVAVEVGFGLRGVAWAQFAGIASFYLSTIPAARLLAGRLNLSPRHINRRWFGKLFAFGWRLHVSSICATVNRQFDKLILSRWAGLGIVSAYEVALRAAGNMGTLQPYLAAALLPASSMLETDRRRDELLSVYRKSTRYLFLIGVPPFAYLALFNQTVITAWLGESNMFAALILVCLLPGYLVNSLSNGMAFVCQGVGRPDIQAWQSALQLVLNVALSLLLFHLIGPMGAPIGTSIALILGAAWFARLFHRHLGIATWPLLKASGLVPLTGSLVAGLAAWLVTTPMGETGRLEALLKLLVSFGVFSVIIVAIYILTRQIGRREFRVLTSAFGLRQERGSP
jgi:O-antigen/teichoic acid export membrane protein